MNLYLRRRDDQGDELTSHLCVESVQWEAQLKTILFAKLEVPVSKPEKLPKETGRNSMTHN